MKHIIKYLRPFWAGIIAIITLLLIQSITDLNLPNYMSNIINIGLQQNGVEHSAPDAISESAYKFITKYMTDYELKHVEVNYTMQSTDATDEYLNNDLENIYVKNQHLDAETIELIDNAFSYASFSVINLVQDMMQNMPVNDMEVKSEQMMIDSTELSIDMLYQLAPMLNKTYDEYFLSEFLIGTRKLDLMIAKQTGIAFTTAYYDELGIEMTDYQQAYIVKVGIKMLGIALLGGLATVLVSLLTSIISARVARNLREQLFNKINSFSHEEFDKFSTSSLITRSTNDVMQVRGLCMMGIRFLFYAPLMLIGGVYMALSKSLSMAWIIALSCILIIGFISLIMTFVMPKFKIMQKLIDKINLVGRETLTGLMVIRAFGTAKHESVRFEKANSDYADNNLYVGKAMSMLMPFMMFIMNITGVMIVWFGAHEISESAMQVGDMMAFIQYSMQIIMSFLMIGVLFVFIPRALVSAQRINEILTVDPVIKDPVTPIKTDDSLKGVVEFKDVSFRYNGAKEDALECVNFTAKPGQTVAFIGATGAGKTTVLNLIPRFYDVTKGEVLVEGVNVKDLTKKDLRSKIGYIPQKSILMSGTIESNIKYGDSTIDSEMVDLAASISQSMKFIDEKEEGYNSHISQGGSNVSGGQRQRLSIARALAISPSIYLFDDSFSALDYKTDITLRTALKDNITDATIIIIAQRVGTILDADIIYVLEEGRIIASGTHRELLKNCDVYYEIASSQLTKEELENE